MSNPPGDLNRFGAIEIFNVEKRKRKQAILEKLALRPVLSLKENAKAPQREQEEIDRRVTEIVEKGGLIGAIAREETSQDSQSFHKAYKSLLAESTESFKRDFGVEIVDNLERQLIYDGKAIDVEAVFPSKLDLVRDPKYLEHPEEFDRVFGKGSFDVFLQTYNKLPPDLWQEYNKWSDYVHGHGKLGMPFDAHLRAKLITADEYSTVIEAEKKNKKIERYEFRTGVSRPRVLDAESNLAFDWGNVMIWVIYESPEPKK